MTRRRWIADEFSTDRAALTGAHAAHLSRTLRARVGQQFEVACGERVRRATVASVNDDRVEFTLGDEVAAGVIVPVGCCWPSSSSTAWSGPSKNVPN